MVRDVDPYERRTAELVLAVNEAASGYRAIGKGERLTVTGFAAGDGTFLVEDVSEPDASGAITLTVTEVR